MLRGETRFLTLPNGVDLSVVLDSVFNGTINLGSGATNLDLGNSFISEINTSTGPTTINIGPSGFGFIRASTSQPTTSGPITITNLSGSTNSGIVFNSSADFNNGHSISSTGPFRIFLDGSQVYDLKDTVRREPRLRAEAIFGNRGYQQRVNGDCNLLVTRGVIERQGSGGPADPYRYYVKQ
jgi:hypothetical protein